jgi:DNA-binding MarR family transcriptional regulator
MSASPQALAQLLGRLILELNRASSPELFRLLGELEISFSQVKALHFLQDMGEASVKDIGEKLGLSFPAASRALDGLAQRGYVERRESTEDRRSRLVRLLPAGSELLDRIARGRLSALEDFTATLSPVERVALHTALRPIVERIPQ